jgi:hypothetical protein
MMRVRNSSLSSGRKYIATFVFVLSIILPLKPVEADSYRDLDGLGTLVLVMLTEPVIPDVRWEFGGSRTEVGTDLSWPIPMNFGSHALPGDGLQGAWNLVVEPHYQITDEIFRWVFVGQFLILVSHQAPYNNPLSKGLRLEGGAVLGEDGDGWMTGTGLVYGIAWANIGLSYRYTRTDRDDWHDVGIDFQLALPVSKFFD